MSESSLSYDMRKNANIYAVGGIPEYWVVDLINRQLHVFRDPPSTLLSLWHLLLARDSRSTPRKIARSQPVSI